MTLCRSSIHPVLGSEGPDQELLIKAQRGWKEETSTEEKAWGSVLTDGEDFSHGNVGGSTFWQREQCEELRELQQTENDAVGIFPGAFLPKLETPSWPPYSQGPLAGHAGHLLCLPITAILVF